MARPRKSLKTKRISVVVTEQVYRVLIQLTATGHSGKSYTETAEEMIRRGIDAASEGDGRLARSLKKTGR
jgi:hypothetical protein